VDEAGFALLPECGEPCRPIVQNVLDVVIRDDEPLHPESVGQDGHLEEVNSVRPRGEHILVLLRDEPAHRDPGPPVQEREDGIEDRAIHILEADVDPIGAGLPEELRHRGIFRLSPRPARTSR